MSDDLIAGAKWTLENAAGMTLENEEVRQLCDMADRIEELEAKLSESEALLAKAVEGLENVSRLVDNQYADRLYTQTVAGWEQCADDVKDVARTTLAELKGGKDE